MNIFPTKEQKFKIIDDQAETLDRLNRRTEKSKNLTYQNTDKSFRGIINGNEFKIISSVTAKGVFCVMTGTIDSLNGTVKIEIHKVFKVLLSIFLCFPIIGMIAFIFSESQEFSPIIILVMIGQFLMIRYVFIGFGFKLLSKYSLNRLRDVLDLEWI